MTLATRALLLALPAGGRAQASPRSAGARRPMVGMTSEADERELRCVTAGTSRPASRPASRTRPMMIRTDCTRTSRSDLDVSRSCASAGRRCPFSRVEGQRQTLHVGEEVPPDPEHDLVTRPASTARSGGSRRALEGSEEQHADHGDQEHVRRGPAGPPRFGRRRRRRSRGRPSR